MQTAVHSLVDVLFLVDVVIFGWLDIEFAIKKKRQIN